MSDLPRAHDPRAALEAHISGLSPAERELLIRRLREREALPDAPASVGENAVGSAEELVPSRATQGPLSFGQQRLWFLDQLMPGRAQYNITSTYRLQGTLDLDALRAALDGLAARHGSLRTRFVSTEGHPLQVLDAPGPVPLRIEDLSSAPPSEQKTRLMAALRGEARRPFDLAHDSMLRATLVRLADDEHALQFVLHHIATDGWSSSILAREFAELYAAATEHRPADLDPLPIQYVDFARWQRATLQGARLERQLDHWRIALADAPLLDLPTDRPRGQEARPDTGEYRLSLPADLAHRFMRLCRDERVTLFMGLLTVFQALMHRYSGQADFVVGTPIAGRTRKEVEPLIGFFVNTLALRADLSGEPSFREAAVRVRDTTLGAYANQEVPFEKLVEELRPDRLDTATPFFRVMFALQNLPGAGLKLTGLKTRRMAINASVAKFDLTVALWEPREGLRGRIVYNAHLFEAGTIARLARHFERLIEAVVLHPDRPMASLPLLSAIERRRILREWGRPSGGASPNTLLRQFDRQAAERPDAPAVVEGDVALTYTDLNARTTALARRLRASGVQNGDCVGLYLPRSLDSVVAMLAIVRAGAAYVPLDPDYPPARLQFMVRDAGVRVVLTRSGAVPSLDVGEAVSLDLDTADADRAASVVGPLPHVHPLSAAAVFYTSGSTGRPKGTVIPHQAMVGLVCDTNYLFITSDDVVTHLSNIAFDAATLEVWGALLNGARLVVLTREQAIDPHELARLFRRHRATTTFVTTALFNLIAREQPDAFAGHRHLSFGGEAADPVAVRAVLAAQPPTRLINAYGPTEATTLSTVHLIESLAPDTPTVPIGLPISGTTVYVLDAEMQPTPVGVPGELYLGGDRLAWGYLGRPGLTAERFVPDPFADAPGARLYRTGDRVRWRPDGRVEFLGRFDTQIKLRGYRIEPGEIEAALATHPSVRTALVDLRAPTEATRVLTAYVVPKAGPEAEADATLAPELRRFLEDRLPGYLVPAAILVLERLPLTPNGKIDRRALPDPEIDTLQTELTPPRTPAEQAVADVWAEVLGLETVGIESNFFSLGGHSLLATRVIFRLEQHFRTALPLHLLFEHPDVGNLAAAIERRLDDRATRDVPRPRRQAPGPNAAGTPVSDEAAAATEHRHDRVAPIPRQPRPSGAETYTFSVSPAQQRLWFLEQFQHAEAQFNMSATYRIGGTLDVDALRQSLQYLVDRHETLRTAILDDHGRPVQLVHAALAFAPAVEDLTDHPRTERAAVLRRRLRTEAGRGFDLARAPLLRARLYRLGPDDHVLHILLHHIVSDGWSMTLLRRELWSAYTAFRDGRRPQQEALDVQYGDYAVWQMLRLAGADVTDQILYWKSRLRDAPNALDLPADRPRPPVQRPHGGRVGTRVGAPLTRALRRLGRDAQATLFMVLLAGFKALLSRWAGTDDVVVGTPISGRTHIQTEPLIGFFVNALVLRTDLSGAPTFRDLVARVRRTALEAFDHQEVPFEKLVEELQPPRDPSRSPIFQVFFNMFDTVFEAKDDDMDHRPAGLDLRPLGGGGGAHSRFDLTLYVFPTDDTLRLSALYNADLFDHESIQAMLDQYVRLLEQAAADPDRPVAGLHLLSEAERRRLIYDWNPANSEAPALEPTHHLFERQVERTPDALAVTFGETHLSYRDLNARANRLAHTLIRRGVRPDDVVALCLERSIEMVIALLGVIKAGGAYLPLDPDLPAARLDDMRRQARARLALTQQRLCPLVGEAGFDPAETIALDVDRFAAESTANPDVAVHPDNLAYLLFTSGSTGRPKGVAKQHRGFASYFAFITEMAALGPEGVVLQLSNYSFDASGRDFFAPLVSGARLVMIPNADARDPAALLGHLRRHGVTHLLSVVPSLLRVLLETADARAQTDSGDGAPPFRLRQLLTTGEALLRSDWTHACAVFGKALRVVNQYGPTETTMTAACHPIDSLGENEARVPLGRVIPHMRIYVLDPTMEPTPVGVPGEIYIGGVGVTRGYMNRPGLTAEVFLPDPFSVEPGARLYRTGDLGRLRRDGLLEFLGRRDHQVKLRGIRVELGEIEAALLDHEAVNETVVVADDRGDGDVRLVAYIVSAGESGPDTGTLRAHLHARLPGYMVPSTFVALDVMPLTRTGKIDRSRLPAPDAAYGAHTDPTPPRTPVEAEVAEIWADVLGLERIGVEDDFFELGGHSLLATRIVSALTARYGIAVPLQVFFERPTVAAFAEVIVERLAEVEAAGELDRLLKELEALSDEEASARLDEPESGASERFDPGDGAASDRSPSDRVD